jgi:hypothetical protein
MFNFKGLFLVAFAGFAALTAAGKGDRGYGGKPKGPKNFIFVGNFVSLSYSR